MGFTESFSDIKITDEKLKIGHIEYIFEVSINNQVQYFFQLQKFKKLKEKVLNIMKYLIYDKNSYYTCDFNQSEIVYVPVTFFCFQMVSWETESGLFCCTSILPYETG